MSHLKVRGVPWMTYPASNLDYQTDGAFPGWFAGQEVLLNKSYTSKNNPTMDGIKWWGTVDSNAGDMKPRDVFGTAGSTTGLQNGKRYNTCFFLGSYVDNSSFQNNEYTYPTAATGSMMRNVIGFGCQTDCKGSHSDKGGDAQAYLEKVGLFYAHPTTRKRYTFLASYKLAGNLSLNQHHPDLGQYHYAYRIPGDKLPLVNSNKLIFMGMALQFVHDYKAAAHTSRCTIKNMRILVGDGTGLVQPNNTNRIMLIDANRRQLHELDSQAGTPNAEYAY